MLLRRVCGRNSCAGETLFAQGERHHGVFIVESGLVRTFYASPSGREITLAYWKPGNIVGTPHVLSPGSHMWSGVAFEDCQVLALRRRTICSISCGQDPNVGGRFGRGSRIQG